MTNAQRLFEKLEVVGLNSEMVILAKVTGATDTIFQVKQRIKMNAGVVCLETTLHFNGRQAYVARDTCPYTFAQAQGEFSQLDMLAYRVDKANFKAAVSGVVDVLGYMEDSID